MEATDKSLSESQSFEIINRMIQTAQKQIDDDSFYFLLWGWLVFIASLFNFIADASGQSFGPWAWVILMPAGGIFTMIYAMREKKNRKVRTYTDDIMKYVLIAFGVSMLIVLGAQTILQQNTYPMLLMVYGVWLFCAGGAIRFRPLILGGIVNWVLAVVSLFANFDQQLLLLATAVLLGYIIPGYLLRLQFRSKNVKQSA